MEIRVPTSFSFCIVLVGLVLVAADVTRGNVLHHWRFENSPGFLNDSVGLANLTPNSVASQISLPSGVRGQDFPSEFVGIGNNDSAADFLGFGSNGLVAVNSTSVTSDFTIEVFYRPDTIGGVFGDVLASQAESVDTESTYSWDLEIRHDGDYGTQPGELVLFVSDGSAFHASPSGIVLNANTDYYLAASFDLSGGQVTYRVQDLTNGSPLQSVLVAHTATSLNPSARFNIGDILSTFPIDGLIDEVRFSDMVLSTNELLISSAGSEPSDGDFDNNGIVDGEDFLLWQRDPSIGSLADWEANYGMVATLAAASAAVPEPTTCALALAALCLAISRRRSH